jgi:hypothetical protein
MLRAIHIALQKTPISAQTRPTREQTSLAPCGRPYLPYAGHVEQSPLQSVPARKPEVATATDGSWFRAGHGARSGDDCAQFFSRSADRSRYYSISLKKVVALRRPRAGARRQLRVRRGQSAAASAPRSTHGQVRPRRAGGRAADRLELPRPRRAGPSLAQSARRSSTDTPQHTTRNSCQPEAGAVEGRILGVFSHTAPQQSLGGSGRTSRSTSSGFGVVATEG